MHAVAKRNMHMLADSFCVCRYFVFVFVETCASVECPAGPNGEMPDRSVVVKELTRAVLENVPPCYREHVKPVVYDATRIGKFSLHVVYSGVAYEGSEELKKFCLRVCAALPEDPYQKMIDTRIYRKRGRGSGVTFRGAQGIEKETTRNAKVHASGCEKGACVEGSRVDGSERRGGGGGQERCGPLC